MARLYSSPTAVLGKYPMVRLDSGVTCNVAEWQRCTTVEACIDPKPNYWGSDAVKVLVAKRFADRASADVMLYLETRTIDNDETSKLMAWMTDNQATGEEGAFHFLKDNQDIWTKWVSPGAAEKIKASL